MALNNLMVLFTNPSARAGYDTRSIFKQFDGEAPALELWRTWSTFSLPLLPGSHLPGVVTPHRVLSMGLTLKLCANK